MTEELFRRKDTGFILENTIINYCLGDDDRLLIESYVRNNGIELRFDLGRYYGFMTGVHKKFVDRYTKESMAWGIDNMLKVYDALLAEMRRCGYVGNILLTKPDNSKQIMMLVSPTPSAVCAPLELARRLEAAYRRSEDPYPGSLPQYVSTSFSGPYAGWEGMHRAFVELRSLNDLIFFGVREQVITEDFRRATARPCDATAIMAQSRRLLNTVCTGTLAQALRRADTLIDDFVAPSYDMDNFRALHFACADMFSMLRTVYPGKGWTPWRSAESFYTLTDFRLYLHDRLREAFSHLAGQMRYPPAILTALSLINRNYTSDLSLSRIAEYVLANPSSFSSEWGQVMGESLTEYVARLRVRYAQQLLCAGELSVEQIAKLSGFASVKYFREVFKRLTGKTPSQYRAE